MIICHFSDWHNNFQQLPYADIYVCTGDMLMNFPKFIYEDLNDNFKRFSINPNAIKFGFTESKITINRQQHRYIDNVISKEEEVKYQQIWLDKDLEQNGSFRRYFKNKDAPVVVVRGNHDFIDLDKWFGGNVFEIKQHEAKFVNCIKFGGFRGVPFIDGYWSDELSEYEIQDRLKAFEIIDKDLDVLVTHFPPEHILDLSNEKHYGSKSLASFFYKKFYDKNYFPNLKLHLFGHIHKAEIKKFEEINVTFSNAATSFTLLEI